MPARSCLPPSTQLHAAASSWVEGRTSHGTGSVAVLASYAGHAGHAGRPRTFRLRGWHRLLRPAHVSQGRSGVQDLNLWLIHLRILALLHTSKRLPHGSSPSRSLHSTRRRRFQDPCQLNQASGPVKTIRGRPFVSQSEAEQNKKGAEAQTGKKSEFAARSARSLFPKAEHCLGCN